MSVNYLEMSSLRSSSCRIFGASDLFAKEGGHDRTGRAEHTAGSVITEISPSVHQIFRKVSFVAFIARAYSGDKTR